MKKQNIKNKKTDVKKAGKKNSSQDGNKLNFQGIILASACVIVFVLIIVFGIRAHSHYADLKNHRNYFSQANTPIQDWMTIHSVVRHYNLTEDEIYAEINVSPSTLVNKLGIENSTVVDRLTIKTICFQKHLDCNAVVNRLNSIRAR